MSAADKARALGELAEISDTITEAERRREVVARLALQLGATITDVAELTGQARATIARMRRPPARPKETP